MHKILVTGGAGYIGSHTIVDLIQKGFEVVCIDSHINSFPQSLDAVKDLTGITVNHYNLDLCDLAATEKVFQTHSDIVGIIHFAALKAVGESVDKPLLYFNNNLKSQLNILHCAEKYGVKAFIFSSSCTVYGSAKELPVTEETPMQEAESPYGRTKQVGEYILKDCQHSCDINTISLRYFNPAGAHTSGKMGESPKVVAMNLVPVITETAYGKREMCYVHGDDYNTRDGSCIRDYIHVMDIADAHEKALTYLLNDHNTSKYEVFNLGIGKGVSVLEAIKAFEKTSGMKLKYNIGPRRQGDIVAMYADASKAQTVLKWSPKYDIEDIMSTAWQWEQNKKY
ncbi:MAG: UDP-glucose 4-epimerase GalE [Saprospiraceae bacterium]